ncbi:glycosyltransferase family 2 protein [Parvularcula dongshanensis]|uniref:Glycosyltransferase involved in cell wall biosynthesis n=1 Tax=Parvularcula dongshanensis TaxID=1173995 RepID=A0A840I0D8_9PROT|nr:glycosyltransferase family 2 protein [Parvularcula dongshanensis]MBB4658167.1 glycosyltransferase involved in cell wall biosynthesis [Parvularcula dongshanensis]
MTPRPPLSAYFRTLNEAGHIEESVRAALKVAREVIVVDSGSTDGTQDLARAAGATVVPNDWPGSGRQKRFAEERCSYDWLLDLDADEVVSDELAREIEELFARGEPRFAVYALPWVTVPPFGAPWRRVDRNWRTKLYDRRRLRVPDHPAWDQLEVDKRRAPRLSGPLYHHAFTDIGDLTRKVERNMTGRAKGVEQKPLAWLRLRIALGLPVYVLKRYLLRGLWRKGTYGFAFCVAQGYGRWLKDVKLYERHMRDRGGRA